MRQNKHRKAFTIVELVVVIAVIAILSAVLVPTISGVIQKANHSADTQFAASLTIQLAMESVDGDIKNEAELRNAVNKYYGADFYDSLAPKSGKYGYHFWYDVAEQTVVLKSYEELVAPVAGRAVAAPSFSPASPRSLMVNTPEGLKNYFLLDQAGSELADQLKALDNIEDNVALQTVIGNLNALADDADLSSLLVGKLNNTAVANNHGVFGSGAPEYLYIPLTATQLGKTSGVDLSNVKELYLPDGIKLSTGSLTGLIQSGTDHMDPGSWDGSAVIYANLAEDQLAEFVYADSFRGVLAIPSGDRFVFVNGELKKLGSNETFETTYSSKLISFNVSGPSETGKAVYLKWTGTAGTIYYTADHTGNITLETNSFVDEQGTCSPRPVAWTVGGVATNSAKLTLGAAQLQSTSSIEVSSTDGVKYTISTQAVALENLDAKLDNKDGTPSGENGLVTKRTYADLEYKSSSSWTINPSVIIEGDVSCVAIDQGVDITIGGAGASNLKLDGNTLKINGTPSGAFSATVTVTSKAKDTGGNTRTIVLELSFKSASSKFERADGVNTQDKYGFAFVIGTKNADGTNATFALGTLFKKISGEPNKDTISVQLVNDTSTTPLTMNSSDSNWEKWTITIPESTASGASYYIRIKDGDESCDLPVEIVKGAYNVSSAADWKAVPNGVDIAVISPFELNDSSLHTVSAMNSGKNYYSKNIGGKTIYGNYNRISVPTFLVKVAKSNNWFIYMNNGTLSNVVIEGPVYAEVAYTRDAGGCSESAADKGYYVAGVEASGGNIINSYISGFRSPLRADGGTITIQNSTLHGGVFASIYVRNVGELVVDNTIMYQYRNSSGHAGVAIYFDTLNDKGTAGAVKLTVKNGTQFYAWLNSNESYSDRIATIKGVLERNSSFVHTISGKSYVNACIGVEGNNAKAELSFSGTSFADPVSSSKYYAYSFKNTSCNGACSHALAPDDLIGNDGYTYLDFLESKK